MRSNLQSALKGKTGDISINGAWVTTPGVIEHYEELNQKNENNRHCKVTILVREGGEETRITLENVTLRITPPTTGNDITVSKALIREALRIPANKDGHTVGFRIMFLSDRVEYREALETDVFPFAEHQQ